MAAKPIPEGYNTVSPYLIVEEPEKLLNFLRFTFGAHEIERITLPDGTITHAEVKIGDTVVMLGTTTADFHPLPCMVHVYTNNVDTIYQKGLEGGATSIMAPADQFYGDRSAGLKDPMGNYWWIATHKEDVSHEELNRRAARLY